MENKNKIIDELNNIIYELKNKLYDTKSNNKILINNINYYKKINDILCEENEELKAEIHNMKYPIDELVDVVEESHNKEKPQIDKFCVIWGCLKNTTSGQFCARHC